MTETSHNQASQRRTFSLLGVQVDETTPRLACEGIFHWIASGIKTYVCVCPVSTIMSCQDDPGYMAIVNAAGMVTPDGMPVVWAGRRRGAPGTERTYGPDLMRLISDEGQSRALRHFYFGGTQANNERMIERLRQGYPNIQIAGHFAPPHRKTGELESEEIIAMINDAKPDILWIGLGAPKQDYWMANHRNRLAVPIMVGVGAAFDFIAGVKPQAPAWMQGAGLEWLFRLGCEPRRLWKRYLIGNSRFIYLLIKESILSKSKR